MDENIYQSTQEALRRLLNQFNEGITHQSIETALRGLEKLREYEETGVTPEGIRKADKAYTDLWNENKRLKQAMNDPIKFVEMYNRKMEEENKADEDDGWQPHENI